MGVDVFERRDEKTGEVRGYAIFNVQKRKERTTNVYVEIPVKTSS